MGGCRVIELCQLSKANVINRVMHFDTQIERVIDEFFASRLSHIFFESIALVGNFEAPRFQVIYVMRDFVVIEIFDLKEMSKPIPNSCEPFEVIVGRLLDRVQRSCEVISRICSTERSARREKTRLEFCAQTFHSCAKYFLDPVFAVCRCYYGNNSIIFVSERCHRQSKMFRVVWPVGVVSRIWLYLFHHKTLYLRNEVKGKRLLSFFPAVPFRPPDSGSGCRAEMEGKYPFVFKRLLAFGSRGSEFRVTPHKGWRCGLQRL